MHPRGSMAAQSWTALLVAALLLAPVASATHPRFRGEHDSDAPGLVEGTVARMEHLALSLVPRPPPLPPPPPLPVAPHPPRHHPTEPFDPLVDEAGRLLRWTEMLAAHLARTSNAPLYMLERAGLPLPAMPRLYVPGPPLPESAGLQAAPLEPLLEAVPVVEPVPAPVTEPVPVVEPVPQPVPEPVLALAPLVAEALPANAPVAVGPLVAPSPPPVQSPEVAPAVQSPAAAPPQTPAAPAAPDCVAPGLGAAVSCLPVPLLAGVDGRPGGNARGSGPDAPLPPRHDEGTPGARAEPLQGPASGAGDGVGPASLSGNLAEPAPGSGSAASVAGAAPDAPWREPMLLSLSAAALLLPFLALYRRVLQDTCLRNELRRRVLQRVREQPGVSIDRIARDEGCAYQTVRHHVRVLSSLGFLEPHREGGRVFLFENGGRYSLLDKRLRVAEGTAAARVLCVVRAQPGCSPASVAIALGLSRSTVKFHLDRLAQRGLVRAERAGSAVRLFASAPAPAS